MQTTTSAQDTYHVTLDCYLMPATYSTRKDAQFAAGVLLQSQPSGTVAAVWSNVHDKARRTQTDGYNVRRSRARGLHIVHREMPMP